MTRSEYKQLLSTDYWRGYSFAIIKERDFTCHDCKRRFFNQRQKLQIHHLVYYNVAPWSYYPHEIVVLCEECHKKRHGIITTQQKPKTKFIGFNNPSVKIVENTKQTSNVDRNNEIPLIPTKSVPGLSSKLLEELNEIKTSTPTKSTIYKPINNTQKKRKDNSNIIFLVISFVVIMFIIVCLLV